MKVINFFGSPGVGKTRQTMRLTAKLKEAQIDTEASLEVVKEHIHSGSEHLLAYQNFIFSQQERQLRILSDSNEVEFAITDAPLLHSVFYAPENYHVYFKDLVFEIFNGYDNINYFINRNHPYSHQGRIHDEQKSNLISKQMKNFLINHSIPFTEILSTDDVEDIIFPKIILDHRVPHYLENKRKRG